MTSEAQYGLYNGLQNLKRRVRADGKQSEVTALDKRNRRSVFFHDMGGIEQVHL